MLYFYVLTAAQIVLESFPVSSSGHVRLLEKFFGVVGNHTVEQHQIFFDGSLLHYDTLASVYHMLHGITACIIALYFFNQWWFLLTHARACWRIIIKIIAFTGCADFITLLFFLLFRCIDVSWFPLGLGFLITAGLLFSLRWCSDDKRSVWTMRNALALGFVQGCALLPGISRLASTYVAARWLKLAPHKAFQIALLIQWPLITVAFLNSLKILCYPAVYAQFLNPTALLVMLGSSVMAWYGLRFVAYCAATKKLWWFSLYMIIPCVVWLLLIIC